jgi:hypothetical protein
VIGYVILELKMMMKISNLLTLMVVVASIVSFYYVILVYYDVCQSFFLLCWRYAMLDLCYVFTLVVHIELYDCVNVIVGSFNNLICTTI